MLTSVNSILVSTAGLATLVGTFIAESRRLLAPSNTCPGPNNLAVEPEFLSLDMFDAAFLDVDSCAYGTVAPGATVARRCAFWRAMVGAWTHGCCSESALLRGERASRLFHGFDQSDL